MSEPAEDTAIEITPKTETLHQELLHQELLHQELVF
jgi:hypothetical protein